MIVQPIEKEDAMTPGGVLLPGGVSRQPSQRGTVLAVGPEVDGIEVGMQVLFGAFAGLEPSLNPGEKEPLLMGARDILSKINVEIVEVKFDGN